MLERYRLLALAFASADFLFEIDADGRVSFALGATTTLTKKLDTQLPGTAWTDLFDPGDVPLVEEQLRSLGVGSRSSPIVVRMAATGPDGTARRALFSACRMKELGNRIACAVSQASMASLAAISTPARRHDTETQVLDQKSFQEAAADILQAASASDRQLEMTLLELPALDSMRSRLSETQAADLSRRIGVLLRSAAADGQTVGRLGPNRFGLVHERGVDTADVAKRLGALPEQVAPGSGTLAVERTGISLSAPNLSPEESVRALRYAINKFAALPPGEMPPASLGEALDAMVAETVQRVRSFDTIVRDNQFQLAYQPIVSLATGVVHHYEVLARFPEGKGPGELIAFAEEIGIVERFDLAVIQKAIAKLRTTPPDVAFAINVSGRSIENPVFVKCLIPLLEANKDLARRIDIELTESAELNRLPDVDTVLQQIRRLGYRVCLDDFGAGSASFQYLQALRIDVVKIDGAYIRRMGTSKRDDIMLAGIIRLCSDMGIATVAEMVETPFQAEQLRKFGVNYAQGYLFGKPDPHLPSDARSARRADNDIVRAR